MKRRPCDWEACPRLADEVILEVTLYHDSVPYVKPRIELCREHMLEARTRGVVTLRPEVLFA